MRNFSAMIFAMVAAFSCRVFKPGGKGYSDFYLYLVYTCYVAIHRLNFLNISYLTLAKPISNYFIVSLAIYRTQQSIGKTGFPR